MVLDPLAQVGVGMLMPVLVSRRQFMVNVLRNSEGGESEKKTDDPQHHSGPEQGTETSGWYAQSQHGAE